MNSLIISIAGIGLGILLTLIGARLYNDTNHTLVGNILWFGGTSLGFLSFYTFCFLLKKLLQELKRKIEIKKERKMNGLIWLIGGGCLGFVLILIGMELYQNTSHTLTGNILRFGGMFLWFLCICICHFSQNFFEKLKREIKK